MSPSPSAFDDGRLIRRVYPYRGGDIDMSRWPATVPAVGQILRDGLELGSGVTVLVGENGTGKSTVVEVIAEALGLNPQGGRTLTPSDPNGFTSSATARGSWKYTYLHYLLDDPPG